RDGHRTRARARLEGSGRLGECRGHRRRGRVPRAGLRRHPLPWCRRSQRRGRPCGAGHDPRRAPTARHARARAVVRLGHDRRSLAAGAELVRDRSEVIGLHAEGPFLAPDFKGAHAAGVLTAPTPEAVEAILAAADGTLAQITIAAELPGALDAIARFTSAGVR